MSESGSAATFDVLNALGFGPDADVLSDVQPGLSYDFGGFKLSAACLTSQSMQEVVYFSGVLAGSRTLAHVEFEMPRRVESLEQCAAWIVWNLDRAAPKRAFTPGKEVPWLIEGRRNKAMLPWERRMALYRARPRCEVERSWLRKALNALCERLADVDDDSVIQLVFDGNVFSFRTLDRVVPLPGTGSAWPMTYEIQAKNFRHLPKRLRKDRLEISVWDGKLHIGNHLFLGVSSVSSTSVGAADALIGEQGAA
ncbi:MAG: hypothetical protein H6905_11720 [Hyphomicrobiales bacterium]|nr:hypothetical protein [Hyphomicrobiales bacterium]